MHELMDLLEALGACRHDDDPDAWFAGPREAARRAHAVAVCFGCPVRNECLQLALEIGMPGTWGGTSERQRRRMVSA